jgi:ribosomal protein S18 acetylase RimI-like enzyme
MSNFDRVVYNSVMEFANHWSPQATTMNPTDTAVRRAVSQDVSAISALLRRAERNHLHVDWRIPVDWLGSPHFVVAPEPSATAKSRLSRLFGARDERLLACLAITPDPPPAAWVRVAAIADEEDALHWLGLMLSWVMASLRNTAVSEIGWLVTQQWPLACLPALGFRPTNEIVTYLKEDLELPPLPPTRLTIRPAQADDYGELAEIETAVFEPLWRLSAATLALAAGDAYALSFDVAERDGRLIGYQLSSYGTEGAHLVRLTIAPEAQGQGVGSALLAHALESYRRAGLRYVSLNTQADNVSSHYLYQKFGFHATGERLPIWSRTV